jgi:endoglucanase
MDEVGFMVQSVTPEGFLRFTALGGWWGHTLLSQRVHIMTTAGDQILGVICSTPVHFLAEAERKNVLTVDKMYIDVGAKSAEDVEKRFGIRLGDPIVPATEFTHMHASECVLAKGFDDRAGLAAMVMATLELRKAKHPNTLLTTGTVQEEVGTRGAETASELAKPDVAVIIEGTPADDTPGSQGAKQGKLGCGVQIRILDPSCIMNRKLVDFAAATAKAAGVKHQLAVRTSGGTDAKKIHLAGQGIPTVVLGVPARYIHSHNSMLNIDDYLAAIQLIVAMVKKLDAKTVASFTDYLG